MSRFFNHQAGSGLSGCVSVNALAGNELEARGLNAQGQEVSPDRAIVAIVAPLQSFAICSAFVAQAEVVVMEVRSGARGNAMVFDGCG